MSIFVRHQSVVNLLVMIFILAAPVFAGSDATTGDAIINSHNDEHQGIHEDHEVKGIHAHAQFEPISLIHPEKLKSLVHASHKEVFDTKDKKMVPSESSHIIWVLIALALVLGMGSLVFWRSSFCGNLGIAGKLYFGFGSLIVYAMLINISSHYFLNRVDKETHIEVDVLKVKDLVAQAQSNMDEFLLHGIEDKDMGDESIKKVHANINDTQAIMNTLKTSLTDGVKLKKLESIEKDIEHFKPVFLHLTEKFHEVEKYKNDLETLGNLLDHELADMLHQHEKELEELGTNNASRDKVVDKTHLIEMLAECEIHLLRVAKEKSNFLIDKKISRIKTMETELGQLVGQLGQTKKLIPKAAIDKQEEVHDLEILALAEKQLEKYIYELKVVLVDVFEVAADSSKAVQDLHHVSMICNNLIQLAEQKVKIAKSDAQLASIFFGILVTILGVLTTIGLVRMIAGPIKNAISDLTDGSHQISSASSQIASASQGLAQQASTQAARLEESSSALEEISSMTSQNSDNAISADDLSKRAQISADNGNQAVQRMIKAIDAIQLSAQNTAKVINVIDEVAFQTNLLALNAAVEAARAGEAGKGFAVVAEEVRNLAIRCSEGAKDISVMIEESIKNTENGVEISSGVAEALTEIVDNVTKAGRLVNDISSSSEEQAKGVSTVNQSVSDMEQVTQDNAAAAEESAAASQELSTQANRLDDTVDKLRKLVGMKIENTTDSTEL